MKQRDYVFLSLLLIILGTAGWVFYRVHYGFLIATAHSEHYICTIREFAGQSPFYDQILRIGTGNKVYWCDVRSRHAPISSFGFTFAGSYLADSGSITIHESHPDDRYDGYVEFHIGGYNTRCDFRTGDSAEWKKY